MSVQESVQESVQLFTELKRLVGHERKIVAEVLRLLRKVEGKKLHLLRGNSSMFAFCTEFLGYSEAEAQLQRKLERLRGLLAHRNPKGDVGGPIEVLADLALKQFERTKPSSDLEKPTDATELELLRLAKCRVREAAKLGKTRLVSCKPGRPDARRSRYISRQIRREVWLKSNGKCTYRDPLTGQTCQSRYALEVDHIQEFAKGGANDIRNLTLLCASHNKLAKSGSTAQNLSGRITAKPNL